MSVGVGSEAFSNLLFRVGGRVRKRFEGLGEGLRSIAAWPTLAVLIAANFLGVIALAAVWDEFDATKLVSTALVLCLPLLWGGADAISSLGYIEKDLQNARAKTAAAETFAAEVAKGRRPTADDLLRAFQVSLGTGDTNPLPSALIADRVAKQCKQMNHEPLASILALDIPTIRMGSAKVRWWQVFAVRFGILCTFVGLMIALAQLQPLIAASFDAGSGQGGNTNQAETAIPNIVQALAMAFGTSVAGLFAGITLQLVAMFVGNREHVQFVTLQMMVLQIQTAFGRAVDESPLTHSINALGQTVSGFHGRLDDARIAFDRSATAVIGKLEEQDDKLRQRIGGVEELRDEFAKAVAAQRQAVEDVSKAIREGAGRIVGELSDWVGKQGQAAVLQAAEKALADARQATQVSAAELLSAHAAKIETVLQTEVTRGVAQTSELNQMLARSNKIARGTRRIASLLLILAIVGLTLAVFVVAYTYVQEFRAYLDQVMGLRNA